jgi:hypothetical protein
VVKVPENIKSESKTALDNMLALNTYATS